MTRKQAISRAIELLELHHDKEISEITAKLSEILEELPLTHWSEATIHDAIKQFAAEQGRNPTTSDLKKANMPPHPVIKNRFGITAKEFLSTYYPATPGKHKSNLYDSQTKAQWTKYFRKQVLELKPKSGADYDRRRDRKSPSWVTIAKFNEVRNWTSLLQKLNLPPINRARERKDMVLNVTSHIHAFEEYSEILAREAEFHSEL